MLERSPRKVGCLNPIRERPKSLKQVVTASMPKRSALGVCHGSSVMTDAPCHSRCGTLKNPHCSFVQYLFLMLIYLYMN